MRRLLPFVLLLCLILVSAFFFRTHQLRATQHSGCVDIPASPDYLSTGSARDAIAAINNARQAEHIRPLYLPTDFYQLPPIQQQFILLNLERTDRNLAPLQMDEALSQVAQGYSEQMLDLHFFSHTSPIGGSFLTRINSNPTIANHYRIAAENLAGNPVPGIGPIYEYMYHDSAEHCGHRENILDPELKLVGIGLVYGGDYGSISTQEYIESAPWSPYRGGHPALTHPQVVIHTTAYKHYGVLDCEAQTSSTLGNVRTAWFLDSVTTQPLHIGASWSLDLRHLSPGSHTVIAYAVDGEQSLGVGQESISSPTLHGSILIGSEKLFSRIDP